MTDDLPVPDAFELDGDGDVVATALTQGPWAPGSQFGGGPCALLTWAVERVPALVPMRVARLTFDLHRPVPIDRLRVQAAITREGKRLQLVTATIHHHDVEVARVSALRLRRGDGPDQASDPDRPTLTPPPFTGTIQRFDGATRGGTLGRVETRVRGSSRATAWYRATVPVVGSEPLTPLLGLATVADFASNAANHLDPTRWSCINPDLTVQLLREPRGEWFAIATRSWYERDGIGHSRADVFDRDALVGTITASSLVDETPAFYAT